MSSPSAPPEGTAWQPALSGNSVAWDGTAVVKQYGTNLGNYYRELALLTQLQQLPVAHVVPGSRPGHLRLGYIDGLNGLDLVEAGYATKLLYAMGHFLRQLHTVDPQRVADVLPGTGTVIVHGDFAPYNCLMDHEGTRLLAVLDWEVAHLGSPVTDLAWCEWQFRTKYPHYSWALSNLFEGYGEEPAWSVRQAALLAWLDDLRQGADIAQ
jgi:aminoglycoside phosphotransferase (APT) family kinase protein